MKTERLDERTETSLALASVCLVLGVFLVYKWWGIFVGVCSGYIYSDVPLHIELARGGNDYGFSSLLVKLLDLGGQSFLEKGLAVALTLNNVLGLFTLSLLLRALLPSLGFLPALLASMLAHICGPWIIPGYQTGIYMGAYNGNLYHNMTVLFSRSFIPLCLIFFFRLWENRRCEICRGDWLGFMLSLFLCTGFKPNFAFALIPLAAVLMIADLIKTRGRSFKPLFIIGCAILPAGFLCIAQYLVLFDQSFGQSATDMLHEMDESFVDTSSGIAFRFLWGAELLAVLVMYLRSLALPIYTLALQGPKEPNKSRIKLFLWVELIALVEASVLVETGYRANHGNFDWGGLALYPAVFGLGIALLFRLFQQLRRDRPGTIIKPLLGLVLLLGHLATGLYFMYYFAYVNSYFI